MPNLLEMLAAGQIPGIPNRRVQPPQVSPMYADDEEPSFLDRLGGAGGLGQGLMQTGFAMMAQSDQGGGFFGNLGRSAPIGIEAAQQFNRNEQLNEAMQGLPPNMQRVLKALPMGQRAAALMQMQQPLVVGEGERLFDPATLEVLLDSIPDDASPSKVREYEFAVDQGYEGTFTDFINETQAPGVTVNTGDRAASAAGEVIGSSAAQSLVEAGQTARSALGRLNTVGQMKQLLERPEARQVFGPGTSIRTLAQRFSNDPAAREVLAQYNALAGEGVLQGLDAFTGAISDKEREYIERISSADPSMTVEELSAGLSAIERIQKANARRYLDEVDSFDPSAFDVTEQQMGQFRALAGQVRTTLGTSNDPLGIR